jgi:hypothetical protein
MDYYEGWLLSMSMSMSMTNYYNTAYRATRSW